MQSKRINSRRITTYEHASVPPGPPPAPSRSREAKRRNIAPAANTPAKLPNSNQPPRVDRMTGTAKKSTPQKETKQMVRHDFAELHRL